MRIVVTIFFLTMLHACSVQRQMGKIARQHLLADTAIRQGHIGISIVDAESGQYLFNHHAQQYFTPASNTKLFTWYAATKYMGDSLLGLRYQANNQGQLNIMGTADPSFLHPQFVQQPVFEFLKKWKQINYSIEDDWVQVEPWGRGWQLDDYPFDYAAERSAFPIYGNLATFFMQADTLAVNPPAFFNSALQWKNDLLRKAVKPSFHIERNFSDNNFYPVTNTIQQGLGKKFKVQQMPFKTSFGKNGIANQRTFITLLEDTLKLTLGTWAPLHRLPVLENKIYSRPTDSLLKPMMQQSDNFFAEQTLLMISNELLGYMNDKAIIDTLLNSCFKDLPQQPHWVDGSGLSRYNLATPQSLVGLLLKAKNEFSWERIKNILPTGGMGTLKNYYLTDSSFIYAKTGTLSNNCALSGYLITRKNKLLIFSVLVNNYPTGATPVRRAVEKFIKKIRHRY